MFESRETDSNDRATMTEINEKWANLVLEADAKWLRHPDIASVRHPANQGRVLLIIALCRLS